MDDRELIRRVEAADPVELAGILNRATAEEERVLEDYLGADRYRRMRRLAMRVGPGPGPEARGGVAAGPALGLGNVVLLPGIMGSELSVSAATEAAATVWLSLWRIALGQIGRLRLARDGVREFDESLRVRPTGILKKYYGEIALSLARSWNVKTYWYDWRKDLDGAADGLHARIGEWFPPDAPVHIVAHSMGGLVARTFVRRYPDRWKSMRDGTPGGARGGRLLMLGTPNYGAFLVPNMVVGLASTIRKLALADFTRDLPEMLEILQTFLGSWQMLPSPRRMPEAEPLYDAGTYGDLNVNQALLDNARRHHELLAPVIDPDRMAYVAGFNQPTLARITDYRRIREESAYEMTMQGDGSVTHALGLLDGVRTYFVESEHSALTSDARVLRSLDDLLQGRTPSALGGGLPVHRGAARAPEAEEDDATKERAARERARRDAREMEQFSILLSRMRTRGLGRRVAAPDGLAGPVTAAEPPVTETERRLEEEIVRGFLAPSDLAAPDEPRPGPDVAAPTVEVALVLGSIEGLDKPRPAGPPVDAIAVGHYLGVRPAGGELALDRAISAAMPGGEGPSPRLILTDLSDRNVLRGLLGQPFFLEDPRPAARRAGPAGRRLIAVAGMGRPGTFGVPELIVTARELCWSLGRLGRRHLASVLIGAGKGNISPTDAVDAWLAGIAEATADLSRDGDPRLRRVTLVEIHPDRIRDVDEAIRRAVARPDIRRQARVLYKGLQVLMDGKETRTYRSADAVPAGRIEALILDRIEAQYREAREAITRSTEGGAGSDSDRDAAGRRDATRLNVEFQPILGPIVGQPPTALPVPSRARYIYSAITETASVPEREVVIDPRLIEEANDKLPAQSDPARQAEIGRALGRLLLPDDLAPHLNSQAPLVLTVDANTARIHWEMVAQPVGTADGLLEGPTTTDRTRAFLSTYRTLTRQLRTSFAGLPNPNRGTQREIRVLVVADPAGGPDALVGARAEGLAVAELFEQFNARPGRPEGRTIQVESLVGPREATRFEVMSRMLNEQYDVLHFAGHCYFNAGDPSASGWIFDGRQVLSAHEMRRVRQVPRFIFSNACESGITPDRSDERSAGLAPSFAEAFFAQGVVNFVCTAWPVDDATALRFARRLYAGLLGFDPERPQESPPPLPMHRAMQEARLEAIRPPNDPRTWGAYQHYGNPHFRFFDPASGSAPPEEAETGEWAVEPATAPKAGRKRSRAKTSAKRRAPRKRKP